MNAPVTDPAMKSPAADRRVEPPPRNEVDALLRRIEQRRLRVFRPFVRRSAQQPSGEPAAGASSSGAFPGSGVLNYLLSHPLLSGTLGAGLLALLFRKSPIGRLAVLVGSILRFLPRTRRRPRNKAASTGR
ncbi:MAG: hypothetical protein KIT73_15525 [Burkholderiales bacterium]|nr:hypothetical protein [Burkholderiales bacterium]